MLYGWFSEKAKNIKLELNSSDKPKSPDIFYTNTTGAIVEVTYVTKTPTLNKKTYRWDDVVYMGELVSQVRCKPTTPIAVGTVNDA